MPWYGWMILGAIFLATEMFVIDAQFYLVFLGFSALLVGLAGLVGIDLPAWSQWLMMAVIAAVTMFTLRKPLYERSRRVQGTVPERIAIGERIHMTRRLAAGELGQVEFRGTLWSAINESTQSIEIGQEAEIIRIDGLTLRLRLAAHNNS